MACIPRPSFCSAASTKSLIRESQAPVADGVRSEWTASASTSSWRSARFWPRRSRWTGGGGHEKRLLKRFELTTFNGMDKKKKLVGRKVQVVLRVSPAVDKKVRAIAEKEERSYASVLRQALNDWLEAREKRG